MNIVQIFFLAVLQGLTEFLPISSSGHLILLQNVLGISDVPLFFDVALHFGSLAALLIYFRAIWLNIFKSFFSPQYKHDQNLLLSLLFGSIPIALGGFLLKNKIEDFDSIFFVGITMGITGILFLVTEFFAANKNQVKNPSWRQAIFIGLFQFLGLLPGVSRSGITTIAGMWQGLSRKKAAEFSFLLGTPAIFGATILTAKDLLNSSQSYLSLPYLLFGIIISFLVSIFSIKFMLRFFQKQKLTIFAVYLILLSFVAIFSNFK